MRRLLACIALSWLAPRAARADVVAEAMTGPFPTVADACASLVEARLNSTDEELRQGLRVNCRAIDYRRAPDGGVLHAVLVRDSEFWYQHAVNERSRAYAIAIRRADGWWLSQQNELDLDGNAYLAGNCCFGKGGSPRYALVFVHVTGFSGSVAALQTSLPLQRMTKPGWGIPDDPPFTRNEVIMCGDRGHGPRCVVLLIASCDQQTRSTFAIEGEGETLVSGCSDGSHAMRRLLGDAL
jgi:hypothetical protein